MIYAPRPYTYESMNIETNSVTFSGKSIVEAIASIRCTPGLSTIQRGPTPEESSSWMLLLFVLLVSYSLVAIDVEMHWYYGGRVPIERKMGVRKWEKRLHLI